MKNMVNLIKESLWIIVFAILSIITILFIIGYFLKGSELSERATENAQRIIIPLTDDGKWIGKQILTAKEKEDDKPAEVAEEEVTKDTTEESIENANKQDSKELADGVIYDTKENNENQTAVIVSKSLEEGTTEEKSETGKDSTGIWKSNRKIPKRPNGKPLAIAPNPRLIEKVGEFNVPKISDDGKKPWEYYGKPFTKTNVPMIAVIVHGLGLGRLTTESALGLDSNITLSFSPYARNTQMWGNHARNIGHEILLDLPQESKDYPATDPGPYALLNSIDAENNIKRLHWVMNRVPGFTGFLQSKNPTLQSKKMQQAFRDIANRGLFVVETPDPKTENLTKNQENMGLITQKYTHNIDEILSEEEIQKQLDLLVKEAKKNGTVIAIARPYPITLELIDKWSEKLESMGVKLAPVSAVIKHDL